MPMVLFGCFGPPAVRLLDQVFLAGHVAGAHLMF